MCFHEGWLKETDLQINTTYFPAFNTTLPVKFAYGIDFVQSNLGGWKIFNIDIPDPLISFAC